MDNNTRLSIRELDMFRCLLGGIGLIGVLGVLSCGRGSSETKPDRPDGVATTTIVGDIVRQVAGDDLSIATLLPTGADPHVFIFRPSDLAMVSHARLVVVNGGGLEGQLDRLLSGVTIADRIVRLDAGMPASAMEELHDHDHHHGQDHAVDPHFWTDPNLVMIWIDTLRDALSRAYPEKADTFAQRALAYRSELEQLDAWITEQVARIPVERRMLVADHFVFGHFARRYGFDETGVIIKGFSSLAQPSARDLAELIDQLREMQAPVIFVGMDVNPQIADQIARDTGTHIARYYGGSLSGPEGPAADYLSYMRHNVSLMVQHLAGEE
jgi:ABC-type Zn uptake system ZnuABC Zn-binding protein ZnuA